jgi:peptidoglycan-associated lipoprotein
MKRATLFNLLVAILLLTTAATGCKKNPKNITPVPNARPGLVGTEGPGDMIDPNATRLTDNGAQGTDLGQLGGPAEPWLNADEDRAALAEQSIYFDYDRSAIKVSEHGKLDEVATYMKSNQGVQLRIEGNCDERGTEEYNRALGERRAIAARDYLIQKHGVESGRVTTLSNGEDKPVDLGKTEEAYARNRRDDFVILRAR